MTNYPTQFGESIQKYLNGPRKPSVLDHQFSTSTGVCKKCSTSLSQFFASPTECPPKSSESPDEIPKVGS